MTDGQVCCGCIVVHPDDDVELSVAAADWRCWRRAYSCQQGSAVPCYLDTGGLKELKMDRFYRTVNIKDQEIQHYYSHLIQHDARQRCPALIVLKEEHNNSNRRETHR